MLLVDGCWYNYAQRFLIAAMLASYNCQPEQKPIENIYLKLTTNAEKKFRLPVFAESCSTAGCYSISQHSSKPNIGSSFILSTGYLLNMFLLVR
jgi:hypothetical protein